MEHKMDMQGIAGEMEGYPSRTPWALQYLYSIRTVKNGSSEMNITPELLSDLYPHFFWETYLLQYCASSRLAETQSIYLLVRNFTSLRTEQWSGGQNGSRRYNILGRGEQEAKLMLLSEVNGGCSQRPADPGKV